MKRTLVYIALVVTIAILAGAALFLGATGLFYALLGIFGGLIIPLIDALITDWERLRFALYGLRMRRRRVRVSIGYLFRIAIDGKYLLVRSARWGHFHPVGGVYKFYETARPRLDEMHFMVDEAVRNDAVSKNDLRIQVRGWRLAELGRWFSSAQDREIGGWREFYEELIQTDILSSVDFNTVDYRLIRRRYSKLRWSPYANLNEVFITDIFELRPSSEQESAIRALVDNPANGYIWADPARIRSRGASPGANFELAIGENSEWIL